MKKLVSMGVAASILLSSLTGCSSNKETSGKEETAKATKGPVEIEFWYGLGGALGEQVEKTIASFNASQTDYKVVGIPQGSYDETFQKLQAGLAAKKAPDAVLLTAENMHSLASKDVFEPLESYMTDEFNADDLIPAFKESGMYDGEQVGLPLYGTTQVLYYRQDVLKEHGFTAEDLKTWESLRKVAETVTKKEGTKTTFFGWEPMWGAGNLIDAALSNDAKIISEDGKKVLIDSKEWVDTFEFFRSAIHDDKIMTINHGGQGWEYWYKTIDDVMQNRAAGYTGSSGDQGDLDFSIVAAAPQPGWEGKEAAPIAEAQMISIPNQSSKEEKQGAFEFIQYFISPEKTAEWSMNTGYIAVRNSAQEVPAFKEFAAKNPQILVPVQQAATASPDFIDPTGGKIYDALSKATDKIEIQNVPVKTALKEAAEEAQRALDTINK